MRKSNTVIAVLAVIAAIFLLWLWYFRGFNKVDAPLDMVLTIIWLAIIGIAVFLVQRRENTRRELVRRVFITQKTGWLYNSEIGAIPFEKPTELAAIEGILARIDYKNMEIVDKPDDFKPEYIVRTFDFQMQMETDAQTGEEKKVITDWEGELYNPRTEKARAFGSKDELGSLLVQVV